MSWLLTINNLISLQYCDIFFLYLFTVKNTQYYIVYLKMSIHIYTIHIWSNSDWVATGAFFKLELFINKLIAVLKAYSADKMTAEISLSEKN